jgi:hypothetical protein
MPASPSPKPGQSDRRRDRRKGPRIVLEYPVEIVGFDHSGRIFSENTTTRNVSEDGCQIECGSWLEPGDLLTLRRRDHSPESDRPQLFQVAWTRSEGFGLLIGAKKIQQRRIWDLHFPPGSLPDNPQ